VGEAAASGDTGLAIGRDAATYKPERGTLYVVATPLGNLRDMTLRAIDVLSQVDVVAAEDTRVTAGLLARFGISKRPLSVHAHNEARRASEIVDALASGKSVALVSDAGTPAVSDPGARVVQAARAAGHPVVPIAGPCAAVAAISAAGLSAERFVFVGFLPGVAKARRELLASLAALPFALAIYEAPHRVRATIAELADALGGDRSLVVARELTKRFETIVAMRLDQAVEWIAADANRERGEFVLLVDAPERAPPLPGAADADRLLRALIEELPPARAARVAATVTGLPRDELFGRAVELKGSPDGGQRGRRRRGSE